MRHRRGLRHCVGHLYALMEKDLHDRNAAQRLRFDVLDIINGGGKNSLVVKNNSVRHVLRGQSRVVPDDADNWDINVWEDVCGRAQNGDRAQYEQQNRHHNEGIWPA